MSCKVPLPLRVHGAALLIATCTGCASTGASDGSVRVEAHALSDYSDTLAWSNQPPGLAAVDVPQFVAVTFDDNFVSGLTDVTGGMTWATDFFEPLLNPAGEGIAGTFDGAAVRTTYFNNCLYLEDSNTRQAWTTAFSAGHEIANHTVNHPHGAAFSVQNWTDEIAPCTAALTGTETGVGASVDDIRGFRSPYLEYNENLFAALTGQGLEYDSSVPSCWGDGEDGTNCSWPYTLDSGSPDGDVLSAKFALASLPAAAGLWEVSPSALFVPPDEVAEEYGFTAGLRQRIPADMPAPSFYEASTGRIAPLDVTLFVDAGMNADEVLATLKYTLDQRLSGNRAPFVFVAHTHVYASSYGAAVNA
ncbi:MAG TPA: polysaccharide deacetylase family protein, partial [Polyangiaceae bacterium]|nr:polysaccharide deacetylase family protein [Polyangiaceae bacterium]